MTNNAVTNAAKKKIYWAIFNKEGVVFEGTFSQCWIELVNRYATLTLEQLEIAEIRIARKS